MERREARRILEEIRVGKRYCRLSQHFEEALSDEDLSIEQVWHVLRTFTFRSDPEEREDGSWRVRVDGLTIDGQEVRLVIDLGIEAPSTYVTVHSIPSHPRRGRRS